MLALVVARPGLVRDGLSALLSATPDVRQVVQVEDSDSARDFVQTVCPALTIFHVSPLTTELVDFIKQEKEVCDSPLLMIVKNEEERKTAVSLNPDLVVMEGIPSAKLAEHITTLINQPSE